MTSELLPLSPAASREQTFSSDQAFFDTNLVNALQWTLAYADVFDYPLTLQQLHRYLIGMEVPFHHLQAVLGNGHLAEVQVSRTSGFFTLAGRESIVESYQQRARYSKQLWAKAAAYGKLIARLPFVRMVAVTGALAMNNATPGRGPTGILPGDDIDYLIVTVPERLWLCRALVILLVRFAALRGDTICPNYFLSERAVTFEQQNLYTAHELVQMVPLSGEEIYTQMRNKNTWSDKFLPNAKSQPQSSYADQKQRSNGQMVSIIESPVFSPLTSLLEKWEMERKVQRFQDQAREGTEVSFCADWCKGHFDGHGSKTMRAFKARLQDIGLQAYPLIGGVNDEA